MEHLFFCNPSGEEIVILGKRRTSPLTSCIFLNLHNKFLPYIYISNINYVFNNSSEGIFPKSFKSGKIILIFKSDHSNSAVN